VLSESFHVLHQVGSFCLQLQDFQFFFHRASVQHIEGLPNRTNVNVTQSQIISLKQELALTQFSDSLMPGHIEFGQKVINYRIPISMLVHFEEVINLIIKNAHFLVLFLFLRCIFVALESYSIFRSCLIYCKIDYVEGGSCDLPLPGFENRFRLILGTFKLDMPLSGLVIVHCNLLERESFCR
jgi:hypothetical protein